MLTEIESATDFLSNLLRTRGTDSTTVDHFRESLKDVLTAHYHNHWFPEKPFKGSAYRCLRICKNQMDPLISKAGGLCGLSPCRLLSLLPSELTMWVDPDEVAYRIGEEGSIGHLLDYSSSAASSEDESSSSPAPSDSDDSQGLHVTKSQDMYGCTNEYMGYHTGMGHNMEYLAQYVAS